MMYIYGLCDPETKEIRYVGATRNLEKRLQGHLRRKSDTRKERWIAALRVNGLIPKIKKLEIVTEDNWQERERYWIAKYRKENNNLLNIADGGIGILSTELLGQISRTLSNIPRTQEWKDKISKGKLGSRLSLETKEKIALARRGKKFPPHSDETKNKIRMSHFGIRPTEEIKQKISKSKRGKPGTPHTDEWKQRMSILGSERRHSEETKFKLSAIVTRWWKDKKSCVSE